MTAWSKEELQQLADAQEMRVSPLLDDGVTHRFPTTIWCVVVGDALYARAYNGPNAVWYKSAMHSGAGRIEAAGVTKEVGFESAAGAIDTQVDEAYSAKYRGSEYLAPMLRKRARVTTVRITPR